jgi:hypothetical protein
MGVVAQLRALPVYTCQVLLNLRNPPLVLLFGLHPMPCVCRPDKNMAAWSRHARRALHSQSGSGSTALQDLFGRSVCVKCACMLWQWAQCAISQG